MYVNNADSDKTPLNAVSDQSLHCLHEFLLKGE